MPFSKQRYVSKELSHFVGRGLVEREQFQLLIKIIKEGWITFAPHNSNIIGGNLSVKKDIPFSSNEMYNPDVVCFCDIPMSDLQIHIEKYSAFGLSFNKEFILKQGGCPVFYIPITSNVRLSKEVPIPDLPELLREGRLDTLQTYHENMKTRSEKIQKGGPEALEALFENVNKSQYFDEMIPEYYSLIRLFRELIFKNSQVCGVPDEHIRLMKLEQFLDFHLFSFIKFFNPSYNDEHEENYYLEREWRVVGNVQFTIEDVETIFIPKKYSSEFKTQLPECKSQLFFVT